MKSIAQIRRVLSSEPLFWGACQVVSRAVSKIKSALLARIFNAPDLYLGPGSLILGSKHISFGRGIFAHGNLWLQAVTEYRQQQFQPKIEIGNAVSFSQGVHITCIERIVIHDGVLMGSHVHVSDHSHGIYKGSDQSSWTEPPSARKLGGGGPVEIGKNVWIGDNAVILGPVTIGEGAVIGANSVVKDDVAAGAIVAGIPARAIKQYHPQSQSWERV